MVEIAGFTEPYSRTVGVAVDPIPDGIGRLAAEIDAIHQQAVREYAPLVDAYRTTWDTDEERQ